MPNEVVKWDDREVVDNIVADLKFDYICMSLRSVRGFHSRLDMRDS